MVGNGWEWTSTVFAPFPGFEPFPFYANYSAPFFDGQHYVLKGASPRTAACFLRPSFRNWFRPAYPYIYATFRMVEALMFARAPFSEFAREVRQGLTRTDQKTLPCRFLYDSVGSALFDAITYLPEYGLTRADIRILQSHADDLVQLLPGNVDRGGTGQRQRQQDAAGAGEPERAAGGGLLSDRRVADGAGTLPAGTVAARGGGARWSAVISTGCARWRTGVLPDRRCWFCFLGSTIGNFEPEAAIDFLLAVRLCLQPGDALLLGTDLVKPTGVLIDAYDDPTGCERGVQSEHSRHGSTGNWKRISTCASSST